MTRIRIFLTDEHETKRKSFKVWKQNIKTPLYWYTPSMSRIRDELETYPYYISYKTLTKQH